MKWNASHSLTNFYNSINHIMRLPEEGKESLQLPVRHHSSERSICDPHKHLPIAIPLWQQIPAHFHFCIRKQQQAHTQPPSAHVGTDHPVFLYWNSVPIMRYLRLNGASGVQPYNGPQQCLRAAADSHTLYTIALHIDLPDALNVDHQVIPLGTCALHSCGQCTRMTWRREANEVACSIRQIGSTP